MRALLLAVVLSVPSGLPDVLPPGSRAVEHRLVLEWNAAPEGTRFVASPVRGFHGHHVIVRGEPFVFSGKYGTRIHAVPAGAALPEPARALPQGDWPSAAVPVAQIASVAAASPLTRVVTTLRVERLDGGTLELAVAGERRFGPFGLPIDGPTWLPIAAIGVVGALWLLRLRRVAPRVPA